ncbi:MAG TPA: electron transfer flavoprotein subunit beta [Ktedonobacter sp.]|nr:electron transfer flavoprotein subunit beta [Ktedonobacter sp.]
MHSCVCIKQTPDSTSVYIDPITGEVDVARFVQILNPADACAVEAAVRFKEKLGGDVTAITLGPVDAEGALRAALALGADTAVRLWNDDASDWDAFAIAETLAAYIQQQSTFPDIILCGEATSDWSSGIVGPALAQYLDLPQMTEVVQLAIASENDAIHVQATRRLERGYREQIEGETPLLLTVSSSLNEPRYPSLPAHLNALKAPIPVFDPYTFLSEPPIVSDETTLLEVHTPRPLPRHVVGPNSKHSAYQRIGEIVSGGATSRKARLVQGSSQELAQALVDYLQEQGFV